MFFFLQYVLRERRENGISGGIYFNFDMFDFILLRLELTSSCTSDAWKNTNKFHNLKTSKMDQFSKSFRCYTFTPSSKRAAV